MLQTVMNNSVARYCKKLSCSMIRNFSRPSIQRNEKKFFFKKINPTTLSEQRMITSWVLTLFNYPESNACMQTSATSFFSGIFFWYMSLKINIHACNEQGFYWLCLYKYSRFWPKGKHKLSSFKLMSGTGTLNIMCTFCGRIHSSKIHFRNTIFPV